MRFLVKIHHWLTHPYRIYRMRRFLTSRLSFSKEISVRKSPRRFNQNEKPIILFSSCENSSNTGDLKYNGGIKIYNLWTKLLREHGYDAYIVTYDGTYQPWLIEHQPCISLSQAKQWKEEGKPLKFVTCWLDAKAFIGLADQIYFHDCEIAYTATFHSHLLVKFLESKKIRKISTNSRTQQAWYMAKFSFTPQLIPDWSDEKYWFPKPEKREAGLVGYMEEGPRSEAEINEIINHLQKAGLNLKFIEVKGNESEVIDTMRKCDFYLGLNPGKHPLWGEGCPRSPQEAMHAGCIVIAYDVHGNREYLIDGYSGFLAPRGRPDILANFLINLMHNSNLKEKIRATSMALAAQTFNSQGKWSLLVNFLELNAVFKN